MSNFLPPENAAAYALLAIIADPVATKKRLDELSEIRVAATKTYDEARAMQQAAAKDRDEIKKLVADRADILQSINTERAANEKMLENIAAAKLPEREAALTARENALADAERQTATALADAKALKKKWQTKMDKFKEIQSDAD